MDTQSARSCWATWPKCPTASGPINITHYNLKPTFDVLAGVQDQDLGSVASAIDQLFVDMHLKLPPKPWWMLWDRPEKEQKELESKLVMPRGTTIVVRGQVESMRQSFQRT